MQKHSSKSQAWWKQTKWPSIMNKQDLGYTYPRILFSPKKAEILMCATTWASLDDCANWNKRDTK